RDGTIVFGGETHFGYFPEAHEMPVRTAPDYELAEVFLALEAHVRAQRELACLRFQSPRRKLHVLPPQGVLDVRHGELARGERLPVDPDAHGVVARAVDPHTRDAGNRREPVDEVPLRVI